ncbi:hypothetical protein Q3Y53_01410 [Synechococcus sp. YX-04-1]|uniref:hypothetical protein n=1 Tax=Synechococcus sp. YX-04-1 TaxID=3062778 RepID=UPI0026E2E1F7|nr:hypothetical protein [Synechococcus sp. YX-04-1]MDO6351187.1 hypothetical protein [Synechococcus sp. YX-04-1]
MDADFEQHYQAAERAYGLGEYAEAHTLASALWDQLQSATDEHDRSLVLDWQAVVSLLLGHIQLHGLQQPEEASFSYQQVLEGEPDATISALAEQGLERCRSEHTASEAGTTPATDGAIPDLLKDPFLSTDSDQAKPARADVVTAMPWLSSDDEPQTTPGPTPTPAPVPSPEPTLTPEAALDVEVEIANHKPEPTEEEPPLDAVEPTPQEPAATDLLEKSWLRVQLQPPIKSPTDSNEPMGLINRIKEAIARSAGR